MQSFLIGHMWCFLGAPYFVSCLLEASSRTAIRDPLKRSGVKIELGWLPTLRYLALYLNSLHYFLILLVPFQGKMNSQKLDDLHIGATKTPTTLHFSKCWMA